MDRLRQGRVFVAGDVAHIYSPAAPQDMNTGIQEAVNLAWKIALVLRGEAEDRLLDTYDEERRPIEGRVLTNRCGYQHTRCPHGPLSFLRDHAAAHVFDRPLEGGLRPGERAADITASSGCWRNFPSLFPNY